MPRFPGFDLKELQDFYDDKNNEHVKDFIKLGAEFVNQLVNQLDTSTTDKGQVNKEDDKPVDADYKTEVTDVELSQSNRDTTEVDPSLVDSCMAAKDTNVEDLSKVTITSHTVTPAEKES